LADPSARAVVAPARPEPCRHCVGVVLAANAQAKIQLLAGLVAVGLIVADALRLAGSRDAGRGWVELALRVLLVRLSVGW
jgi:hypothetical protein